MFCNFVGRSDCSIYLKDTISMINTKFMNKIKKIVFFTVALAFSFKGYSQVAVAKEMTVGATLLQIMTIADTNKDLNFGRILHTDPGAATVILNVQATTFDATADNRDFSTSTVTGASDNSASTQTDLGKIYQHAVYTITGSYDHAYTITLSETAIDIEIEGGTETMEVKDFKANVLDADGTQTKIDFSSSAVVSMTDGMGRATGATFNGSAVISFGATLNIGANQRGGVYSNTDALTVTVNYE